MEALLVRQRECLELASGLLLGMTKCMATHPEKIRIKLLPGGAKDKTVLLLQIEPVDVPILLGRNSQTARAFRVIFSALGVKMGMPLSVEIEGISEIVH